MRRQNALGYGNVVRERYCWVLNYADGVAIFPEKFVDFFPTGAIHETAMDEDDCLYSRINRAIHSYFFLSVVLSTAKSSTPPGATTSTNRMTDIDEVQRKSPKAGKRHRNVTLKRDAEGRGLLGADSATGGTSQVQPQSKGKSLCHTSLSEKKTERTLTSIIRTGAKASP
jgi:hypothetical protein